MLTKLTGWAAAACFAASLALAAPATAQQRAPERDPPKQQQKDATAQHDKVHTVFSYRSSTLTGMAVKNRQGEDIGKIEDMLIDIRSGKVGYAILSFGGFLGFGDKLFPIPWRELTVTFDEKDTYLVADLSKEFLDTAPSFDRRHWPDMTGDWMASVDAVYPSHSGTVVSVADDRLVMDFGKEMGEQTYPVATNAAVTRDGAEVGLKDLKQGDQAKVKTQQQAGIRVVTRIDAESGTTIR